MTGNDNAASNPGAAGEDFWSARYRAAKGYLFGTAPAAFLLENPWVSELPAGGGRALSLADGEGRNAVHLARRGWQVSAFDLAEPALERAHKLALEAGVSLDIARDDLDNGTWAEREDAYDLVLGIFMQVFGDRERKVRLWRNIKRVVKPGGRVALHGYRPEQLEYGTGGPPSAANMWTVDELARVFEGWQFERLAAYDKRIREGTGHDGMSALVDLVARKPVD